MTMAELMFSHSRLVAFHCDGLAVAHCNFHLRKGDCDLDEALVKTWAEEHAVAFFRRDFDTVGFAKEAGVSIEMAARELRYKWFAGLCREQGFDAVATAHNADDNAETLLLNLCRGTGVKGLCGMSEEDVLPYSDGQTRLLRPLLGLSRAQIEEYARENQIPFRTDKSNFDNSYKRNRIRNQVLPVLKELNPSVIATLNQDMRRFRQASDILDLWCEERSALFEGDRVSYSCLLDTEGWEYLLWHWLEPRGFNSADAGDICRLVKAGGTRSGKRFPGKDWTLLSDSDGLRLVRTCAGTDFIRIYAETRPFDGRLDFGDNGNVSDGGNSGDGDGGCRLGEGRLLLDADRTGDWEERGWQEGDWFVPFGMQGRKKLSDWFTDRKISAGEKAGARVIAPTGWEQGHIAAVFCPGVCRQDERTRVTSLTRTVLELRVSSARQESQGPR